MKHTSECDGCMVTDYGCSLPSYFQMNNRTNYCPCQVCLLKGICEDICDSFTQYYDLHNVIEKDELNDKI